MKGFYRRERIYRSEIGESFLFHEVCPEKLTLNKNLHPKIFKELTDGWNGTIFNEVNVVPFVEAYDTETKNFYMEGISRVIVGKEEFAKCMFNKLMSVIEDTWIPEKFHVIPHSSGYDSRLISTILKRLKKKHGSDWIGDYLFVEAHGESDHALEAIVMEGWKKSHYIVINENVNSSEAHAHNFEFTSAWRRGNGYIGFPVNVWYGMVEWLQNKGLVPIDDDQIQCYTGYGANETMYSMYKPSHYFSNNTVDSMHIPKHGVGWYFAWHYYHHLSGFTLKSNWIHPFYNLDYLREFIKYSKGNIEEVASRCLSVSSILLSYFEPELGKLHKLVTKEVTKRGYNTISDRLLNKAIKDYRSSWYGKNIKPNIIPTNRLIYCDWWGSWYVASFCEYLLKSGHSIR